MKMVPNMKEVLAARWKMLVLLFARIIVFKFNQHVITLYCADKSQILECQKKYENMKTKCLILMKAAGPIQSEWCGTFARQLSDR